MVWDDVYKRDEISIFMALFSIHNPHVNSRSEPFIKHRQCTVALFQFSSLVVHNVQCRFPIHRLSPLSVRLLIEKWIVNSYKCWVRATSGGFDVKRKTAQIFADVGFGSMLTGIFSFTREIRQYAWCYRTVRAGKESVRLSSEWNFNIVAPNWIPPKPDSPLSLHVVELNLVWRRSERNIKRKIAQQ